MDGFSEDEVALVKKVRMFYHLQESGMFHVKHDGRGHSAVEANRRRTEIKELRDKLGLTVKQQASLVNRAVLAGIV